MIAVRPQRWVELRSNTAFNKPASKGERYAQAGDPLTGNRRNVYYGI